MLPPPSGLLPRDWEEEAHPPRMRVGGAHRYWGSPRISFFLSAGEYEHGIYAKSWPIRSLIKHSFPSNKVLVFDWFEATVAALGSKICTEIFVLGLQPSILLRSPRYFSRTYLGWSRSSVRSLVPNAQDSAKWRPFYLKKMTLLHFSPSLFYLSSPGYSSETWQRHC